MPPGTADSPAAAPHILGSRWRLDRGARPVSHLSPPLGHTRRRVALRSRGLNPLGSLLAAELERRGD